MTSKNRNKPSAALDAYYTPEWVVRQAIQYIVPKVCPVPARILEPGAGDGRFVRQLRERYCGSHITAVDMVRHDWPEATESIYGDFLTVPIERYDLAIGNPPFSLALQFIQRCLMCSKSTVLLLRQGFLSSAKRNPFWRLHGPSDVFVLPDRPHFTIDGKGGDSADYCFVCWGRPAHDGVTRLHWLPTVPVAQRR